jgi:hypothetical protein
MPKKDKIHEIVKKAMIKSGWEITDDPYVISYGERFLFIDLGAQESDNINENNSTIIGAKQNEQLIAIEIKEFTSPSPIVDLVTSNRTIYIISTFTETGRTIKKTLSSNYY